MLVSLYPYFIIVVGIAIYIIKPKWIMIYWLITIPVLFPIINLSLFILDREVFQSMISATHISLRNLFLLLIIIELTKKKFRFPLMGDIYIAIGIVAIYMLFHNVLHHPDHIDVWAKTSEVISLVLPLMLMTIRKDLCPDYRTLCKTIGLILILQMVGIAIDYSGNHVYPTFYIPYVNVHENGVVVDDSVREGVNMGTFPSASLMADYLSTIYLFVALEYFSGHSFKWKMFVALTMSIGIMILFSGVRAAMLLFVFAFFISNLIYLKRHFILFTVVLSIAFSFLIWLISFDVRYARSYSENEGINRQIEGLASFVQSKNSKEEDKSTFRLTPYLLENYFMDGFFLGNGREHKGEFAYGNSGSVTLELFFSDARLAYIAVEFGILGLLVYFFFFNSIFNFLKKGVPLKDKKKLTICFIFLGLMTIVDVGLFSRFIFPLVYLYRMGVLTNTASVERIPIIKSFSSKNKYKIARTSK